MKPVVERGKIEIDDKDNYLHLRYHISGGNIDKEIKSTIKENPESFWMKNFSIVNGGQTVYVLHQSKSIDKHHNFWLSCKIIKTLGITETEKMNSVLKLP